MSPSQIAGRIAEKWVSRCIETHHEVLLIVWFDERTNLIAAAEHIEASIPSPEFVDPALPLVDIEAAIDRAITKLWERDDEDR